MCKIKVGEQIKDIHDVQNLVTALILGTQKPYSITSITTQAIKACKGSQLNISHNQIRSLVIDTTTALLRNQYLISYNGYYHNINL